MHHIEYLIKHNKILQKLYVVVFSSIFKFIGLFIKTDKKQVMFQSLIGRNYGDSPKVIFDAMKSDPYFEDYKYVWAFDNPDDFDVEGATKVKLTSLNYFITALKSGVWIANVNMERGLKFKPKNTKFLNTGHGAQFKLDGNLQGNRCDYDYSDVDFWCSYSEFSRKIDIESYGLIKENTHVCGVPRDDELYELTQDKILNLKEKYNIPLNKKVILYAPTWRDSSDGGSNYTIAPPINIDYWKKNLEKDYVVIFRMHHLSTKVLGIEFDDFVRDGSNVQNVNELMAISDIMISDYSSIVFDYAILKRPIISFAYDYDEYIKARGLCENLYDMFPESVFKTEGDVINHILTLNDEIELKKSINIKNRYVEAGGNATQVCIDFIKTNS